MFHRTFESSPAAHTCALNQIDVNFHFNAFECPEGPRNTEGIFCAGGLLPSPGLCAVLRPQIPPPAQKKTSIHLDCLPVSRLKEGTRITSPSSSRRSSWAVAVNVSLDFRRNLMTKQVLVTPRLPLCMLFVDLLRPSFRENLRLLVSKGRAVTWTGPAMMA